MVSQRTVLTALIYFSLIVFVSIWLMTKNFPDKICDCSACVNANELKRTLAEKTTISSETAQTLPTKAVINDSVPKKGKHKLGVIVPYRERFEELLEFVPHMSKYLAEKNIWYQIYVINQVDEYRFNRASLINIGYLTAISESCDYIAMHDVDLLPLNKDLNYSYPASGPFHVSAPSLHPKYHYPKFIGGIFLMTDEQFKKVNGLSTKFWGWGREDDELYMRIKDAEMTVFRPVGIKTGYNTFKHNHDKKRKRDFPRDRKQYKESFKRDYESGLSTMKYKILQRYEMAVEGERVSVIAVQLQCDHEITPWCTGSK